MSHYSHQPMRSGFQTLKHQAHGRHSYEIMFGGAEACWSRASPSGNSYLNYFWQGEGQKVQTGLNHVYDCSQSHARETQQRLEAFRSSLCWVALSGKPQQLKVLKLLCQSGQRSKTPNLSCKQLCPEMIVTPDKLLYTLQMIRTNLLNVCALITADILPWKERLYNNYINNFICLMKYTCHNTTWKWRLLFCFSLSYTHPQQYHFRL